MKIMSSKSQISLEFTILLGFLVILIIGFLLLFLENQADAISQSGSLTIKSECFRLASAISGVYAAGDGTVIRTRTSYNLTVGNNLIKIKGIDCSYSGNLSPKNITGKIAIKNKGGTVILESY